MRNNGTLNFQKLLSTALYMRISKEDEEISESVSIENQRKILKNYAKDNGFIIFEEYIDDGYTGTNFERPAFKRLKKDIVAGKVGVVLTKDFSRLGRNTGQVMTVLDDFFTRNGVRYISITEGIDTFSNDITGILAPMLSFTNEMYSGDISRKINASLKAKMKDGEYIGAFAPYGYKKDPNNKNHLLPDKMASDIVKRIFTLAKNGYSPRQIANFFNDELISTPSKYRFETKMFEGTNSKKFSDKWSNDMISKILRNEVYLGHTLQGKTHKPSFKTNYIKNVPKNEWIRVENTHEALIDYETWRMARERIDSRTQIREKGFTNIFSGVARCGDCGKNMSTVGSRKKGARANLNCGAYKRFGAKACMSHSIDFDVLYNIVLEAIRRELNFIDKKLLKKELLYDAKSNTTGLCEIKEKLSAITRKLIMLYDKKFSFEIDDDSFEALKKKYELEKKNLESIILKEERFIKNKQGKKALSQKDDIIESVISKYENLDFLDTNIIFKLIDKINVHQGEYIGKSKRQKIDIHFKFETTQKRFFIRN